MQARLYPHLMANTPLKRIRVDDDLWEDFGLATEALGLDRTKALVAFMRRFVTAMSVDRQPLARGPWPPVSRSSTADQADGPPHSAS